MERLNNIIPVFVKFIPTKADMQHGKIYISEEYNTSSHLCPCGCGALVVCPIKDVNQGIYWGYQKQNDKVTLTPSIYNKYYPCNSHYFIKKNQINWV